MANAAACDDGSIGPAVDGCRGGFDFTLLFEQSFLSIMPSSLFLVLAAVRLAVLRYRRRRLVAGSGFRAAKLAAVACHGALQAALLVLGARTGAGGPAGLAAAVLALVDAVALAVLSWFEHGYSPRPSALIGVYLLLSLLFDAVQARTLWLRGAGTVPALLTASLAIKAAMLALESVEKDRFLPAGWCHRSPEEKSGIFSKSLLLWLRRILAQGRRRIISPEDLYALERGLETRRLSDAFWRKWCSQGRRASPRATAWVLVRTLKWPLLAPVMPRLAQGVLTICQPLLLQRFLGYLEGGKGAAEGAGYCFVGAYGLVYGGLAISACFYRRLTYKCLVKMRGCLVAAIYKKTTDIDAAQYDMTAPVALMSTDVERILRGCKDLHEIWANAVQAGVSVWLLYRIVGGACAAPAVMAALASLGSFAMSPYADRAQRRWMEATQRRVAATAKALADIKAVRLLGQSDSIQAMLRRLRAAELGAASRFRLIEVLTAAMSYAPLLLSPVLTFVVLVTQARRPDTTLIFTALSLLQLMTQPLVWLFQAIPHLVAALGCLGRVGGYLNARQRPERRLFGPGKSPAGRPSVSAGSADEAADDGAGAGAGAGGSAIAVRNGGFGWTAESPVLRDVNVDIPASRLTMVVGPVASGKSTLAKAIIGELPFCTGEVHVKLARAAMAYCDQTPFLVNGTLQQNVVGFADLDSGWYEAVVRAVDLARDLSALPDGGQTRIGTKGVVLSGGQRQRVAIARAVYARPSLAVFDDALSGLDAATKETVFDNVFGPRGLLRQAACTVVLSTHDVDLLPKADHIVALARDGRVAASGTFERLSQASAYIASLAIRERAASADAAPRETPDVPGARLPPDAEPPPPEAPEDASRRLGDASIYRYLLGHVGLWRTLLFAAYQCGWAVFSTIGPVWLESWASAMASGQSRHGYYMAVYAAFQGLALVFLGLFTGHTLTTVAVRAGASLHDVLLRTAMAAPLALFASVDVGVTTNRFSQDVLLVDGDLPLALLETVSSGLVALVQAVLIARAAPYLAVAYPLVGALLYVVQSFYLRTSRQLRLLELEAKSPLYTHFLETLHGLATIRAFGWAAQSNARSHRLVDESQRPLYLLYMVQRWLQLVLDLLTAAVAVVLIAVAVRLRSTSAELMGVALVNLMSVSAELKMVVVYWTNLETSLSAVARIKAFEEKTPSEHSPREAASPPPPWPQTGHVVLDSLCARYDASEGARLCLDGVSATIRGGQRVAVCGRSGSGKSSLVMALARMVDLASGSIVIDGVDISTLSPTAVRAALNLVPQEPCFFHPTVAQNLDPAGSASPEAMRAALEQVRLWAVVEAAGGLDAALDVDTLSQGQRQLLALARAVLRPGSIVVLDEATSNVDQHSAAVMQRIVRDQFAGRTVIAVAHQLCTVVDFDHVLVMDAGRLVESAPPAELLARDSLFKRLCDLQGVGTQ